MEVRREAPKTHFRHRGCINIRRYKYPVDGCTSPKMQQLICWRRDEAYMQNGNPPSTEFVYASRGEVRKRSCCLAVQSNNAVKGHQPRCTKIQIRRPRLRRLPADAACIYLEFKTIIYQPNKNTEYIFYFIFFSP